LAAVPNVCSICAALGRVAAILASALGGAAFASAGEGAMLVGTWSAIDASLGAYGLSYLLCALMVPPQPELICANPRYWYPECRMPSASPRTRAWNLIRGCFFHQALLVGIDMTGLQLSAVDATLETQAACSDSTRLEIPAESHAAAPSGSGLRSGGLASKDELSALSQQL